GHALARCGPAVLPAILEALQKDARPEVAVRAAEALRPFGPAAKEAVPFLVAALKKPANAEDRLPIVETLGRMGAAAGAAVPELVRLLETVDETATELVRDGLQVHVVMALGRIGPSAKAGAPALVALLKSKRSPGDPLPQHVLEALGNI